MRRSPLGSWLPPPAGRRAHCSFGCKGACGRGHAIGGDTFRCFLTHFGRWNRLRPAVPATAPRAEPHPFRDTQKREIAGCAPFLPACLRDVRGHGAAGAVVLVSPWWSRSTPWSRGCPPGHRCRWCRPAPRGRPRTPAARGGRGRSAARSPRPPQWGLPPAWRRRRRRWFASLLLTVEWHPSNCRKRSRRCRPVTLPRASSRCLRVHRCASGAQASCPQGPGAVTHPMTELDLPVGCTQITLTSGFRYRRRRLQTRNGRAQSLTN
jgi:hypothetical protein